MELFELLEKLYTKTNPKWINEVDNSIPPIIINKWLAMNKKNYEIVKELDKYTFILQPKQFVLLAWSMIPKEDKMPFVRYYKEVKEEDEFDFIWSEFRKKFEISNNDFEAAKKLYKYHFKNNMIEYFKLFGVSKKLWKKYDLDFNEMKAPEEKMLNINDVF